jgi:hypothetical protein
MTVGVPRDTPSRSDFYYVLVSAWDEAQSYDQLGFTSGSGVWGVSYSTTTPCAGIYSFVTDAYNLTAGTSYNFTMSVSAGIVEFSATPVGGSLAWSHSVSTGATSFIIAQRDTCGTNSTLDYTDYEEVYDTAAPVPPYPFSFTANEFGNTSTTAWVPISGGGAPLSVPTAIAGSSVTIENEPYSLSFPATLTSELSNSTGRFSLPVTVNSFGTPTSVSLSQSGVVIAPSAGSWSFVPSSGTTPFTSNLTLTLLPGSAGAGSYPIEVVARDPGGRYAQLSALVVVDQHLNATAPVLYPSAVDVNQSLSFSELPTGGARPFHFDWLDLPTGCAGSSGFFSCRPTVSGPTSVSVIVIDALGVLSYSTSVPLDVSPQLTVTVAANRTGIDVGQWVGFTLASQGGSGGNHVVWAGGGGGCAVSAGEYDCPGVVPGLLNVSVTVTDSNGFSASPTAASVVVSPDPRVALSIDPSLLDLGMAFTARASASGGSGGLTISWHGLPPDCLAPSGTSTSCRTAVPGYYALSVSVVDANSVENATTPQRVTVNPDPIVRVVASGSDVLEGNGLTLTAEVSGGSGGWSFAWSGLPDDCPSNGSASLACSPGIPGQYEVRVVATDATGTNGSAVLNLTVAPALLGLPQTEGVGVLVLVVAVVAIAVVLLVRRPRRPPSTAPRDGPDNPGRAR